MLIVALHVHYVFGMLFVTDWGIFLKLPLLFYAWKLFFEFIFSHSSFNTCSLRLYEIHDTDTIYPLYKSSVEDHRFLSQNDIGVFNEIPTDEQKKQVLIQRTVFNNHQEG